MKLFIDIMETIKNQKYGPVIIALKDKQIEYIIWKGKNNIALLIGKEEQQSINYMLTSGFLL